MLNSNFRNMSVLVEDENKQIQNNKKKKKGTPLNVAGEC
jgi:hypothetical protein